MELKGIDVSGLIKSMIDAFPAAVFVVDRDMCIIVCNSAALELAGNGSDKVLRQRGGDALHCLEAVNSPDGCSSSVLCADCAIRTSIDTAVAGMSVIRTRGRFDLVRASHTEEVHMLITASPFTYDGASYALLVLEDVSELTQLKKILPICISCKKIRNDQDYWDNVDNYFEKHLDLSFSHGLCPDCMDELYPEFNEEANGE